MPKIGPTGEFSLGAPMNETDKGGIFVALRVERAQRRIIMNFNTTVDWFASPRREGLALAQRFRELVTANFGKLPYNAATLPIKVTANREKSIIISRLPVATEVLIANPEMFLGWADRLETAARQLD